MTTIRRCLGGYQAVGKAEEEGKCGGRRRGGYPEGNELEEEISNELLQVKSREGHRKMVGEQDRADRDAACPRCGEEDGTLNTSCSGASKSRLRESRMRRKREKRVG